MSVQLPPTKRIRRSKVFEKDAQYVCGLLNEIEDLLIKFEGPEVVALQTAITDFVTKYNKESTEEEEESEGEEIKDDDSWSDECSEHTSDREFIAPSDEEEDGEYIPSSEEEEEYESSEEEEEEEDD